MVFAETYETNYTVPDIDGLPNCPTAQLPNCPATKAIHQQLQLQHQKKQQVQVLVEVQASDLCVEHVKVVTDLIRRKGVGVQILEMRSLQEVGLLNIPKTNHLLCRLFQFHNVPNPN